ncbi:hypothetical protein M408DRAFT_22142 [Serendipita vermifera MAFF 305830]|uniref:C2H2-type domain-containing protein n=1 Tax=Serendipita vermifera MAFF 305830 TaxID=933852 RepID=A0A0C3BGV2_SERVB|nr:hypothetical protein M408DRAFT_22142 [Serendipita vermifera MAFF 305830]
MASKIASMNDGLPTSSVLSPEEEILMNSLDDYDSDISEEFETEGRLFTVGDAHVSPDCEVYPSIRLDYDAMPKKDKEWYQRSHVRVQKQPALINFIKHFREAEQNNLACDQEVVRALPIYVPNAKDNERWQCPRSDCNVKKAKKNDIMKHIRNRDHIAPPMFPCRLGCGERFCQPHDRPRHEKKHLANTTKEQLRQQRGIANPPMTRYTHVDTPRVPSSRVAAPTHAALKRHNMKAPYYKAPSSCETSSQESIHQDEHPDSQTPPMQPYDAPLHQYDYANLVPHTPDFPLGANVTSTFEIGFSVDSSALTASAGGNPMGVLPYPHTGSPDGHNPIIYAHDPTIMPAAPGYLDYGGSQLAGAPPMIMYPGNVVHANQSNYNWEIYNCYVSPTQPVHLPPGGGLPAPTTLVAPHCPMNPTQEVYINRNVPHNAFPVHATRNTTMGVHGIGTPTERPFSWISTAEYKAPEAQITSG